MTQKQPRIRLKITLKLFLSHFMAVLLVSGSIGTFFYMNAVKTLVVSLQSRMKNSAALLSQGIDTQSLDSIRSPEDMKKYVYMDILEKLRRLRQSNPDIAFLYIMRKEEGAVSFVVDSDETAAQAKPGHVYTKTNDLLLKGFTEPSVDDKIYHDEWGSFLSGYAPLRDGQGRYLIGMDMLADEVKDKLYAIRLAGLISLLGSLLLAMIFSIYLAQGLSGRLNLLVRRCQQIASGDFEEPSLPRTFDEFDALIDAFDVMSANLSKANTKAEKAIEELQESRDMLEVRVQERTRSLEAALEKVQVLSGMLPICASCKKIRNDKGYWQQVEQFVGMHTGARFSHGLCPECVTFLYGEILSKHSEPEKNDQTES